MSEQETTQTNVLERIESMFKNFMVSMSQASPLPYSGEDANLYADPVNMQFPIANVMGDITKHWFSNGLSQIETMELSNEDRLALGTHMFTQYTHATLNDEELLNRILKILRESENSKDNTDISITVNPDYLNSAGLSETSTMYEFPLAIQFSATEEEDGLTWRTILRTGTWAVSPSMKTPWNNDGSLVITPERIQELKANFDEGAFEYVTVPDTHQETPLNNRGFIKSMKIVPDEERDGHYKLKAGFHITNEEAKKSIIEGSLAGVSCGIIFDHKRKSDGKTFGAAIHHVALTNQPWIDGLGGWEKIAASQYNVATVEIVGTEENEHMEDTKTPEVNTDELQAQLAEMRAENARLRLSTLKNEVKDTLNSYQKEKHLTPAVLSAIEPILLSAKMNETKVLALSDDGSTSNEIDLEAAIKAFLDAMPVQADLTDPKATTGESIQADQTKPESADDKVELSAAEKAAEIRKALGLELVEGEAK